MLEKMQTQFKEGILQKDPEILPEILSAIKEKEGVTREQLISIHRNNTKKSLASVLRGAYPVTVRLVGEEFFTGMADKFTQIHTPKTGALIDYGDMFETFVRRFSPTKKLAYLGDVVALEWAWHAAYHAEDKKPLVARELLNLKEAQYLKLRFIFHPSASLVSSPFAIDTIWQAHQPGEEVPDQLNIDDHAAYLLVVRPEYKVEIRTLEEATFEFLTQLQGRKTMGEAADKALEINPDFDVEATWAMLLASGIFASYRLNS